MEKNSSSSGAKAAEEPPPPDPLAPPPERPSLPEPSLRDPFAPSAQLQCAVCEPRRFKKLVGALPKPSTQEFIPLSPERKDLIYAALRVLNSLTAEKKDALLASPQIVVTTVAALKKVTPDALLQDHLQCKDPWRANVMRFHEKYDNDSPEKLENMLALLKDNTHTVRLVGLL